MATHDFLELLGIIHPVIQAPTSGLTPPALVAALCLDAERLDLVVELRPRVGPL